MRKQMQTAACNMLVEHSAWLCGLLCTSTISIVWQDGNNLLEKYIASIFGFKPPLNNSIPHVLDYILML